MDSRALTDAEQAIQGALDQYATALVEKLKILDPMAGLIDKQAEVARLEKTLGKTRGEAARIAMARGAV